VEPPKKNLVLVLGLDVVVNVALSRLTGLRAALARFNYLLIPAIPGLVSPLLRGAFLRWVYYLGLLEDPFRDQRCRLRSSLRRDPGQVQSLHKYSLQALG
jgi:hypothetical protein